MKGMNTYRIRRTGDGNISNNKLVVMDWTKVKAVHGLDELDYLPAREYKAWVQIMLLAARLERMPNEKDILKYVHPKTLKSLVDHLSCPSRDVSGTASSPRGLHEILLKVLEDVDIVKAQKERGKRNSKEYRERKGTKE